MNFLKKYGAYLCLSILLASHLPFIEADADINISTARGPWSDEGLYTSQIRNYIIHDDLTFKKSPCFLIAPLFSSILFIPFKIAGVKLSVSRLFILLLCIVSVMLMAKSNHYFKNIALLITPILLLQYRVFHFSHLSMIEMPCVISILLGVFFLYKALMNDNNRNTNNVLAALFLSIAYFLMIRYVYIVVLFPLFTCFWLIVNRVVDNKKKFDKVILRLLGAHVLYLLLFGLIYLIMWYIPNLEFVNYVAPFVTADNFIEIDKLNLRGITIEILNIFYHKIVLVRDLRVFNLVFFVSLLTGIIFLFSKDSTKSFRILFLLSLTWLLIEMHKFTMIYLPTRYLVSFCFSMGLLIIVVLIEGYNLFKTGNKTRKITFGILLLSSGILFFSNIAFYKDSFDRRTFAIKEINDYLKNYDYGKRPVMGTWAPSLSWETNAITIPIWEDYFSDKKIIETYNPKVIIIETDGPDFNQVLENDGIDLDKVADSVIIKKIARWEIKIAWLPPSPNAVRRL